MLGLAGSAAAQTHPPDTTPAETAPEATAITMIELAVPVSDGYKELTVEWMVPANYRAACTDVASPPTGVEACADNGDRTPLTGFVVYYADKPFADTLTTGVIPMPTSGGSTALTTGVAEATLEDLEPDTSYYVTVAAGNAEATGPAVTPTVTTKTAKAPVPEDVTGVMAEPGDKMLTVTWDEANPDMDATRTNLLIETYYVQYRESQTATSLAGEWMPMEPMEVMGDMTTTMIEMLTNDVSYDVQVRAENNAGAKGGWSAQTPRSSGTPTAMTPTPALPLFGAFGLGVGLLAAGRARMRQRRQALLRGRR